MHQVLNYTLHLKLKTKVKDSIAVIDDLLLDHYVRRTNMKLYHGSNVTGLTQLVPKQADHDRPYVYLTTIEQVATLYLCNATLLLVSIRI